MNDNPSNLPIARTTLVEMVNVYRQAKADITAAFKKLTEVEQSLKNTFGDTCLFDLSYAIRYNHSNFSEIERTLKEMEKTVWKRLVEKMEIRSILSIKRAEELDKSLSSGEGLPEITESNILAMLESNMGSIGQYIEESVQEVYEWLRPRGHAWEYKTNKKNEWALKGKVIVVQALEFKFRGGYHVNHWKQKNITALDNVFHALDGKARVKTYGGPLMDAISATTTGEGETEYFTFRCFRNLNLHIEFKRPDLLARLNAVAGGMRLGNERKAA